MLVLTETQKNALGDCVAYLLQRLAEHKKKTDSAVQKKEDKCER